MAFGVDICADWLGDRRNRQRKSQARQRNHKITLPPVFIMASPFLTDNSLKQFAESLKIGQDQKEFLIYKIPQLDEEERTSLFNLFKEIRFLDLEEEEALGKIKCNWRK